MYTIYVYCILLNNNIRCSKKKSIIFPIDDVSYLYLALHKLDQVTLDGVKKDEILY